MRSITSFLFINITQKVHIQRYQPMFEEFKNQIIRGKDHDALLNGLVRNTESQIAMLNGNTTMIKNYLMAEYAKTSAQINSPIHNDYLTVLNQDTAQNALDKTNEIMSKFDFSKEPEIENLLTSFQEQSIEDYGIKNRK